MLEKISVGLQHCYGIGELSFNFIFEGGRTFGIYAPNGVMKTSFAKTFQDLSLGLETKDRIFDQRITARHITGADGTAVAADSVFVVEPYNVDYKSASISKLLVNRELKEKYDDIHRSLNERLSNLVPIYRLYPV